ncbi:MAG: Clp protease N-terminal domain-containing protein [Gemmatimonadaceae bacterium]
MDALRPLPPSPNLEFEHKEAKAFLRRLRVGDPDSLARARAQLPSMDASAPTEIKLSDAQLVIAREYGFASWPKLVRYYGDVNRQRHNHGATRYSSRDFYDQHVRALLDNQRNGRMMAARMIAAYVPRFYGARIDEIVGSTVTDEEACLAVARNMGFSSWGVLLSRSQSQVRSRETGMEVDPMRDASKAMAAIDVNELQRVVEKHPDLLNPSDVDVSKGRSLVRSAIHHERVQGREAMRPVMEWLAANGLDLQLELNRQLCGHMYMKTDKVRWLFERGADPAWIPPNGIPVLEHALIRYWNGEAVDVLAPHCTPRKALWISAGLGDLEGVRRSLDANGKPKVEARKNRPDFDAVGPGGVLPHPDPDDEEILMEAFFIAMLNGRIAILEYMASQCVPVNSLVWGTPVLNVAVGNAWTPVVECLLRLGANPDLTGWGTRHSARDTARGRFEDDSKNSALRHIVQLCGMDPDAILAERDSRPVNPPAIEPKLQEALELAGDDAFRLGQTQIGPENLLFGLLRTGNLPLEAFTQYSRRDLERFGADFGDRVLPADDRVERPKIPLNADSQSTIQTAISLATERRRELVGGFHLLCALLQSEHGAAAEMLARYGSSATTLRAKLESSL